MEYKYNISPEKYLYSRGHKRSISKTRTNKNSMINKKFKLSSAFDHKGSKHFLNSKKIALQQIILDDETCLDESDTEYESNAKAKSPKQYKKFTCKRALPNDEIKKHLKITMNEDHNKKNANKKRPEKMKSTNVNDPFRKVYPSSTINPNYLRKQNMINNEIVSHKFFSNQEIKMFEDKDIKKIKPIEKSSKELNENENENKKKIKSKRKKSNNIAENISFMEKNDSSIIDIITNLK